MEKSIQNVAPIIQIQGLRKNYGSKIVLQNINLSVTPGQVIGYIGPNGAGKSTTVKILIGLINDYEGTVTINGLNPKTDGLAIKKLIGYVPENAELYDVLTPFEYLSFSGKLYGMSDKLIEKRTQVFMKYFNLEHQMHQRMDTFSKGMRQKVLLSGGLIHNPEIIILDEPLSGLDANAVILVKDLISQLAQKGKTIFYCSHMMDVVEKVSDRIVLINNGSVIADGSIEELKNQQNTSLEQIFATLTREPETLELDQNFSILDAFNDDENI